MQYPNHRIPPKDVGIILGNVLKGKQSPDDLKVEMIKTLAVQMNEEAIALSEEVATSEETFLTARKAAGIELLQVENDKINSSIKELSEKMKGFQREIGEVGRAGEERTRGRRK